MRDNPADLGRNTILCRGGQIVTNVMEPDPCIRDCSALHESIHAARARAQDPNLCAGKADGLQVEYDDLFEQAVEEIAAYDPTFDCLMRKAVGDPCCTTAIYAFMDDVLQPRYNQFQQQLYDEAQKRRAGADERIRRKR